MFIIDFILHIDEHIYNIANAVGGWTYLILFLVIFIETAAVVFSLGLLWAIPVIFLLVELWDIVLYIISFLVS